MSVINDWVKMNNPKPKDYQQMWEELKEHLKQEFEYYHARDCYGNCQYINNLLVKMEELEKGE